MGTWEFLGEAVDVVEVAVGLVLVLLVELGRIEGLIVEFGGLRWRRWAAGGEVLGGGALVSCWLLR
jgi:hypothetical protein